MIFGNGDKKNKANQKVATQTQIPIGEIRNGIVVLKNGGLRLIMLCSTTNFDLKSEEEQNAIIASYQGFLNSLDFPIQIVIQSRTMDLDAYLKKLQNQLTKAPNALIRTQITGYLAFIKALLKEARIMDKKFFIVVPYELPLARKPSFVEDLRVALAHKQPVINLVNFDKYRQTLIERAQIIAGGLSGIGLRAVQLNTQELVELFYSTYNPDLARQQRLTSLTNIASSSMQGLNLPSSGTQSPSKENNPQQKGPND